jgi:hypothetical protein
VKYCQACGQANQDDARFCEKCGAAAAGGAAQQTSAPTAAVPTVDGTAVIAAVPVTLKKYKYVVIGVVAVVVLVILWAIFLKPTGMSEYSNEADKYTADLNDALTGISEETANYYGDDATLKITDSEWKASAEVIEREEKKIKAAVRGLRGLRPPADYSVADDRIVAWARFYGDEYVPALDDAMKSIAGGMTYERVTKTLDQSQFLTREQQRASTRAWNELQRASKDVDLSIMSEGD